MYNYTELTFAELVAKIDTSRFFHLPKMVAEALRKLTGRIETLENTPTGDFIPLAGTEVGSPVTGDIEIKSSDFEIIKIFSFDEANGVVNSLEFNADFPVFQMSSSTVSDNSSIQLNGGQIGLFTTKEFITITSKLVVDGGRGLHGLEDYTPNITDLDYTQKKYVDDRGSVLNTTTAVLSASDLSTAYPNAKDGFSVIAPNVIGGGKYYIKAGAGWVYQQILAVV